MPANEVVLDSSLEEDDDIIREKEADLVEKSFQSLANAGSAATSLKEKMVEAFPAVSCASHFRQARRYLQRTLGGAMQIMDELVISGYVAEDTGLLTTDKDPRNRFARLAIGKDVQPAMKKENAALGPYQDRFLVCAPLDGNELSWDSKSEKTLMRIPMSRNHRLLTTRNLHWQWFNPLVFGLVSEVVEGVDPVAALQELEDLKAAALQYAKIVGGWSDKVGLYVNIFGHNEQNSLHVHIVDLETTGPGFVAQACACCPLDDVIAVLSEEAQDAKKIRIIFSHASRDKSEVATDLVEQMIHKFQAMNIPKRSMMYQYSMNISPGQHWADIWMQGMQEAEVVIIMMEPAYLKSSACVDEFLASQNKTQAIFICDPDNLADLQKFAPSNGAPGCGQAIMTLATGKQLYLKGAPRATEDIFSRYLDTGLVPYDQKHCASSTGGATKGLGSRGATSIRLELKSRVPTLNDAGGYREVRRLLQEELGGSAAMYDELCRSGWVDDISGNLNLKGNIFAQLAAGKIVQEDMKREQKYLGKYEERFLVCRNTPEADSNWDSISDEWVGRASMARRHRFLTTKNLHWQWFNAIVFGLVPRTEGGVSLEGALAEVEAMRDAANNYAREVGGWSKQVGLFVTVCGHNKMNSLHVHILDMSVLGPSFNKWKYKMCPLHAVIKVLREEVDVQQASRKISHSSLDKMLADAPSAKPSAHRSWFSCCVPRLRRPASSGDVSLAPNEGPILYLNVGGEPIAVHRQTFRLAPAGSPLKDLSVLGLDKNTKMGLGSDWVLDHEGRVFLDHPPAAFKEILDCLRVLRLGASKESLPMEVPMHQHAARLVKALGLNELINPVIDELASL
eukprot:TRINITY_DN11280_c0_g2_i1.p1 TRINITY_DN11280_c0_g2~~TRINITY_DN11280_c0_g2_i1.p1  ORF type:complete len:849 (-),score=111.59 TRINITY_DN11280_c0_g2_i1:212-2758(-)